MPDSALLGTGDTVVSKRDISCPGRPVVYQWRRCSSTIPVECFARCFNTQYRSAYPRDDSWSGGLL